jgi:hypothetical protein
MGARLRLKSDARLLAEHGVDVAKYSQYELKLVRAGQSYGAIVCDSLIPVWGLARGSIAAAGPYDERWNAIGVPGISKGNTVSLGREFFYTFRGDASGGFTVTQPLHVGCWEMLTLGIDTIAGPAIIYGDPHPV